MGSPTEGSALVNRVPDVQARASFDEKFHHIQMVRADCLMQGGRV